MSTTKHEVIGVCQVIALGKTIDISGVNDCVVDGTISGAEVEFSLEVPCKLIATISRAIKGRNVPCKVRVRDGCLIVETE